MRSLMAHVRIADIKTAALIKNREVKRKKENNNKKGWWSCRRCGCSEFAVSTPPSVYIMFTSNDPAKEAFDTLNQQKLLHYRCDNCGMEDDTFEEMAEYREAE